jgi:hypothetical protein
MAEHLRQRLRLQGAKLQDPIRLNAFCGVEDQL